MTFWASHFANESSSQELNKLAHLIGVSTLITRTRSKVRAALPRTAFSQQKVQSGNSHDPSRLRYGASVSADLDEMLAVLDEFKSMRAVSVA